ncbi:HAD-IC family P-type ATPase [Agrococcus sp. Marseille-Q4369]|uniref:HAD-IC family P-type ATPase n=1 Tax=Agrococcus sp. Marseille-Q4369 TaxID=2810513 RepID=UPI001B8D7AC6|nr:HAD-IC family P-type ATPase [Agrococcus sp. Marseille-Q4369]QUW19901.1 HAD-IC family P-type ATPase [Agrococcus sp. Marseille-Q4369]
MNTPARTATRTAVEPDEGPRTLVGEPDRQRLLSTTDAACGLTAAEVAERVADGRVNRLANASSRSLVSILQANLFTLFNLVIAVCTAVLLVLGRWQDALFSFAAISNVLIGVVQEYSAKRKLDDLALLHVARSTVLRDGEEHDVAMEELVQDDILLLRRGDQVPADGVIVETLGLDLDESLLTGESEPQLKHTGDGVLSGSAVSSGSAAVQLTSVGGDSFAAKLTAEARRFSLVHSELRSALNRVVKWISIALVPLIAIVLNGQMQARGGWEAAIASGEWEDAVVLAIAAISASVPQGLILMTSIAFAVAAVKLARSQVLVQELAAVEGLARVDVICLDKTGTLTESDIELLEAAPIDEGGSVADAVPATALERASGAWPLALAWFGHDENANATAAAIRPLLPDPALRPSAVIGFSSARRMSAVAFDEGPVRGTWVLGAPESVLGDDGESPAARRALEIAALGRRALVLGSAAHPISTDEAERLDLPPLAPVAVLAFGEHVRDDAPATLDYFREQGVEVRILSGDHPRTVGAVARQVGMPLEGDAFDARQLPADRDALAAVLAEHHVLGRVTPGQKRGIVEALQAQGRTVAMTGDGVNDALALKTADLGIAMGEGAAATKAVARLVLLDGRFSHLPRVVDEGRQVIANIERVSRIFLTKTTYAFTMALVFGALLMQYPFLPRQLSATDGLTIGIPAFFLALMPAATRYVPGFLFRSLRFTIPSGITIALSVVATTVLGREAGLDERQVQTAAVFTLTVGGLWVLGIACRPFTAVRALIVGVMIAGLVAAVTVPIVRDFFEFQLPPTPIIAWSIAIGLAASALIEVWHRLAPKLPPAIVRTT